MEHGGGPGRERKHASEQPILLDEEVWLDAIEEIVERDFFPDAARGARPEGSIDVTGLSLDQFLHKYTSEDNASFHEILERTNAKRREKAAHLMLPPGARPAASAGQEQLEGKKYEAVNLLMYDGSTRSSLPLSCIKKGAYGMPSKSIHHKATSFSASKAPEDDGPMDVGPSADNPQYSLLETPSFQPGEQVTPFMTWGGIEATPILLHDDGTVAEDTGGDAPQRSGFRMRDTPLREQLAHSLGSKGSKAGGLFSPRGKYTPMSVRSVGSVGKTPSIHAMSPAAQRLAAGRRQTLKTKRPGRQSIFAKRPHSSWDDA